MFDLINKKCVPHEKMVALKQEEIKEYLSQLKDWEFLPARRSFSEGGETNLPMPKASEGQSKITKEYKFKDFKDAMEFVNKVSVVAEKEGHHPDIEIHYNKVNIILWTHFVKGLSENDFIIAAKIDNIL